MHVMSLRCRGAMIYDMICDYVTLTNVLGDVLSSIPGL